MVEHVSTGYNSVRKSHAGSQRLIEEVGSFVLECGLLDGNVMYLCLHIRHGAYS